jgi:hypothetical protein
MRTYVHTYIRKYVRTYIHKYIRKYVRTYIRTYVHTYIRKYVHTYINTYVSTYVHTFWRTLCSHWTSWSASYTELTHKLTAFSKVILENLVVSQLIKNYPSFMEPEVHHRVHKSTPPVPILSHMNPVYILTHNFCKTYFNIIFPSTLNTDRNKNQIQPTISSLGLKYGISST